MLRSPLNAGPTPWLAVAVALAFLVLAMALGVLLARCDDGRGYVPGRHPNCHLRRTLAPCVNGVSAARR